MRGFVALDFETADFDRDSACAVGGVVVDYEADGRWNFGDSFFQLICPPAIDSETGLPFFDDFNISIHGIHPDMVKDSPTFDVVWEELRPYFEDRLLVAHNTRFDMFVIRDSCYSYGISPGDYPFACSYRLAKDTWPNLPTYRLDALAEEFVIPLDHHNALSDAECCAKISQLVVAECGVGTIEEAAAKLGFSLGRLSEDNYLPFSNSRYRGGAGGARRKLSDIRAQAEPSPDHELFGKNLCFTGTLASFSRGEAAQLAVNVGAHPASSVSSKTDYLVVGVTDLQKVRDGSSTKMRKAVEMREGGHHIEIIDEEEFLRLLI